MPPLFSGVATYYHYDNIVKEKLKTTWINPVTRQSCKITVSYKHNYNVPTAIENKLLHSPEYATLDAKRATLTPMYLAELTLPSSLVWPTVTGLELSTGADGTVQWKHFEDEEEIVRRIKVTDIPPQIPRFDISEISYVRDLVATVSVVSCKGILFALKAHELASQNDGFPVEVKSLIQLGTVPHIAQLMGVVTELSPFDSELYVQGILLPYCQKGDLKTLLENSEPPIEPWRKDKWAAQIAHALMAIHEAGLMHGDLKGRNVVVDESDNAFIIDVTNGEEFTEGWTPIGDHRMDPRSDIYSFGVTLWEMIHNGADPVGVSIPMSVNGDASDTIKRLVHQCVVTDAGERPSAAALHLELVTCGCTLG